MDESTRRISLIYDLLLDALEAERFDLADSFLASVDPAGINLAEVLSALTATLRWRDRLPSRPALYQRTSDRILADARHRADHDALLRGLC